MSAADNLKAIMAFKIIFDNKLIDPDVRLISRDVSSAYITSIPVNTILNASKDIDGFLGNIIMNLIILPIVETQETLCNKEIVDNATYLLFSINNISIKITISCFSPSYNPEKRHTVFKIQLEENGNFIDIMSSQTLRKDENGTTFISKAHEFISIDKKTNFTTILNTIKNTDSKVIFKKIMYSLFNEDKSKRPTITITTRSDLSNTFTTILKNIKLSSTGGVTQELWNIVNPNIVNPPPQGGAPKQTKYKKTNQIIAYKNKSYCLYTGIKGGNYIRVKHNGTFIFKYIKPT
jgi:hypothetical protein